MMNETTAGKSASQHFTSFPIGYYHLHPDVSVNFQLNRFYNLVAMHRCWLRSRPWRPASRVMLS
jgi:hypothetical protein